MSQRTVKAKLDALRERLSAHGVDGYIQPVHDAYMSEYPPACFRRVEWLTGFSGSAGTACVTKEKAAVFSDGRYTLQLAQELDTALYDHFNSADITPAKWLSENLPEGGTLGYDAMLFTNSMFERLKDAMSACGVELVAVDNLVDAVWEDRPAMPRSAVFVHDEQFTGVSSTEKRAMIAKTLAEQKADYVLLSAPDSICWLLNIRARDVENTPLLLAAALMDARGQVQLFVDAERCDSAVQTHLGSDVLLQAPETLTAQLSEFPGKRVLCDPQVTPLWYLQALEAGGTKVIHAPDPCILPKACKHEVEVDHIRQAHIRDGVAVSKMLAWVDEQTAQREVSEIEVVEFLLAARAQHPMFVEPSFHTIAGSGPNGAIVHYRPSEKKPRMLGEDELLLVDSGGQYPDGTTDITRTMVIGEPSAEMCDHFTRVLKGHIALATCVFPEGTSGSQLDSLARQFLWQVELDYDHGTGHGVGQFMNVHEGPQRISKRGGDAPLQVGMVISNEPGFYKAGEYGIRIENLVTVVEVHANHNGKRWLGFDTLSCAPIDRRLIDVSMLSEEECDWLNAYHHWVQDMISPHVDGEVLDWLEQACAAV